MKKSGDEVLNDLYPLLNGSEYIAMLSGRLYKDGTMRPLNSIKEDTIMSFKAGLDGQIQEGAVTLNTYVADIDNGSGGKTKNSARTAAISAKARELFDNKVVGSYLFRFGNMVQTYREETIGQHFVSIDLRYRMTTF
jgi:hypothetical protein